MIDPFGFRSATPTTGQKVAFLLVCGIGIVVMLAMFTYVLVEAFH